MNDPLAMYRTQVAQIEPCSETWFGDAIEAARAGDEEARRRIVGSCLGVALRCVERNANGAGGDELLTMIEDANNQLWRSVPTFQGSTPAEFVRHAEDVIESHLSQHPS